MGSSYDIRLPIRRKPIFPETCIICKEEKPGCSMTVSDRAISWISLIGLLGWFSSGPKVSASVPACKNCRKHFKRSRWINAILFWGVILSASYFLMPIITQWLPRPYHKLGFIGLFLLLAAVLGFIQSFFPPAFGMTAFTKKVDYEFKDLSYAIEFAYLNDALDQFGLTEDDLFDESEEEEYYDDEYSDDKYDDDEY